MKYLLTDIVDKAVNMAKTETDTATLERVIKLMKRIDSFEIQAGGYNGGHYCYPREKEMTLFDY